MAQHNFRITTAAGAVLVMMALSLVADRAEAKPRGLRVERADASSITIDGIPGEWNAHKVRLTETLKGQGQDGKPDLAAEVAVAYDDHHIYLGAEVVDDHFRPGGDRVTLTLGFSGGKTSSVVLIPGTPGKSPGRAIDQAGRAVRGAEVVEAPAPDGYSLEAKIPWSAFPLAKTIRVGLRGAVVVDDADASGAVEASISNASKTTFSSLPAFSTAPEQALARGLLRKKSVPNKPTFNLMANVAGDSMKERVLVFGSYMVVLGPTFRGGTQYYWNDMNIPDLHLALVECDPRDVTGDGRADLVLRKRFGKGKRWREVLQILSFGSGEQPTIVLEHETALQSEIGAIKTEVSFVADGNKKAIRFEPGKARGYTAENYREATETGYEPLLLPWGSIESQTFKFQGGTFVKTLEKTRASAVQTPAPSVAPPPKPSPAPAPAPQSAAKLQSQVYASYKKARGVTGKARFTLSANVAGGDTAEKVLLHGRDLVVFGPGYQNGKGYAFTSLTHFADAKDIRSVTARDVTGDGRDEILVRGTIRAKAPAEAGGGEVERDVLLIYLVRADRISRVFAAELGRSIGQNSVSGTIAFAPGKKSVITLGPGKAKGWTAASYPFNQDTGAVGGFQPLILPWSNLKPVQYRFSGSVFEP